MLNIRIYGYGDTLLVMFSMRVFSQNSGTYCMVPSDWDLALLLEEYGVSKKWVIIMDRKQDSNAASTPAEKGKLESRSTVTRSI